MLPGLAVGNRIAAIAAIRIEDKPDEVDANAAIDGLDNADDDHVDDDHAHDEHVNVNDFSDEFDYDTNSFELQFLWATPRSTHLLHRKGVVLRLDCLDHQLSPQLFCIHSSISLLWGHLGHPRNHHHHLSQMP